MFSISQVFAAGSAGVERNTQAVLDAQTDHLAEPLSRQRVSGHAEYRAAGGLFVHADDDPLVSWLAQPTTSWRINHE